MPVADIYKSTVIKIDFRTEYPSSAASYTMEYDTDEGLFLITVEHGLGLAKGETSRYYPEPEDIEDFLNQVNGMSFPFDFQPSSSESKRKVSISIIRGGTKLTFEFKKEIPEDWKSLRFIRAFLFKHGEFSRSYR